MKFFKDFNPFTKPVATKMVEEHLEEYKRNLVLQEASAAYHTKMAEYYREGISRLKTQQLTAR